MNHTLVLNPPISITFRLNLALKILGLCLFVSTIVLSIFYVLQINALTSENHLLNSQEKKVAEMKREAEILKINFAKANSLDNIEIYFQNQNFKKISQVKYIRILDTSVAAMPGSLRE